MNNNNMNSGSNPLLTDYGAMPFVINIDRATKQNSMFRTAIWTGENLQLVLMSINPGESIGLEVHPTHDQFIRVEQGQGMVLMGDAKDNLTLRRNVSDGFAFIVPAGTWHNLINTGTRALRVYTIYAPPAHAHGTIHPTKADAAQEKHE